MLYACSRAGVIPSRYVTWFQAQQACVNSGKRLCTNEEWQAAVAGTSDNTTACNISTSAPENAGSRTACISRHGANDMIGNLWEWVAWWGQAGPTWTTTEGATATPWPAAYNADLTWNINGRAHNGTSWVNGLPAAAFRGGSWNDGTNAGAFALALHYGPSYWTNGIGFRCCLGR